MCVISSYSHGRISDSVYPSLVNESEVLSPSERGAGQRTRKKSEKDDDDLWKPQGQVTSTRPLYNKSLFHF